MATVADTVIKVTETLSTISTTTSSSDYTVTNGTKRAKVFLRLIAAEAWLLSTIAGGAGAYTLVPANQPVFLEIGKGDTVFYAKTVASTGVVYVSAQSDSD